MPVPGRSPTEPIQNVGVYRLATVTPGFHTEVALPPEAAAGLRASAYEIVEQARMNSRLLRSSVAGRDGWSSAARLRIGAVGTFFSAALCICDSGEGRERREGQHDDEECDYGFLEHRRIS
jgi:hypothetical protein